MLRLTLRSGKHGTFLARVVDRGGFPFVLDYGDKRIIDDAQQRLLHGFTMWRYGSLVSAGPQDPEMLLLLAEFYASQGLLVFVEEPTWSGRRHGDTLPPPGLAELLSAPLEPLDDDLPSDHTELIGPHEIPDPEPLPVARLTAPPVEEGASRVERGGAAAKKIPRRAVIPDDLEIEEPTSEVLRRPFDLPLLQVAPVVDPLEDEPESGMLPAILGTVDDAPPPPSHLLPTTDDRTDDEGDDTTDDPTESSDDDPTEIRGGLSGEPTEILFPDDD